MGDAQLEEFLQAFAEHSGIEALMIGYQWAWPTAEILHFTGLCLLMGTIGMFDLRVLGWCKAIPMQSLHKLIPLGVGGFCVNVTTGVMFVSCFPNQYLYNPAFQTKVAFLLLAGVNMLLFYQLAFRDLRSLAPGETAPFRARAFTLISLMAWLGVIAAGRLITFFRPPFYWCFWC